MTGQATGLRLHHEGRFRRWLGQQLGGDERLGDRLWRRILHGLGAVVLLYDAVPNGFFVLVPKLFVLLAALAVLAVLEGLRIAGVAELPTIRPYEARRPASYLYYAVGLVAAVTLFPLGIAATVVLGTALVDPVIGELRGSSRGTKAYPAFPFVMYAVLAAVVLVTLGRWPWEDALALAVFASAVALAVERWRYRWVDDDLTMTIVPALALYAGALVLRIAAG